MDKEYIRDGLEFALDVLDKMDKETCKQYYFNEYKFDKEPPADEVENIICLALKCKLGLNENLTESTNKDSDLIFEDKDWKVYIPTSHKSSCELGKGTVWCTAWSYTSKYYDYYKNKGNLIIFINKKDPKEKYQLCIKDKLFCDKDNHDYNKLIGLEGFKEFVNTRLNKDSYKLLVEKIPEIKEFLKEYLKESDKPATTSIEDAQKWVDYDMVRYGKISNKTNDLIKKAGFQIIKDDHGDYEVTAGHFE